MHFEVCTFASFQFTLPDVHQVPTCNQVGGGARRNQAPRRDPRLAARIRAVRPAHRVARRARGASPSQSCLSRLTPSATRCPHIPQALTGKMVLFGYDADGRPAMYLRPSRQNTEETVRQMHFLTWLLERAVDLMGPGVECVLCLPSSVRPRLTLGRWPCAGLSRSWSISRTRRRTPPSPSRARYVMLRHSLLPASSH